MNPGDSHACCFARGPKCLQVLFLAQCRHCSGAIIIQPAVIFLLSWRGCREPCNYQLSPTLRVRIAIPFSAWTALRVWEGCHGLAWAGRYNLKPFSPLSLLLAQSIAIALSPRPFLEAPLEYVLSHVKYFFVDKTCCSARPKTKVLRARDRWLWGPARKPLTHAWNFIKFQ